jgi:hypothetical protein
VSQPDECFRKIEEQGTETDRSHRNDPDIYRAHDGVLSSYTTLLADRATVKAKEAADEPDRCFCAPCRTDVWERRVFKRVESRGGTACPDRTDGAYCGRLRALEPSYNHALDE